MNEFTSGFWDLYISIITLASILACGVLLLAQSKRRVAGGGTETTGHTWDEDLGEYNNPLPRWWMWLFWITIVFGLVYLALYPGLGSYAGLWKWTQVGQLKEETAHHEAQFGPIYERYAKMDVQALVREPAALAIGQKLFLNNCAQCHASDGAGSAGFPNLTDIEWLWGGTPEAIKTTITEGRTGVMPAWGAVLGEQGVKDAAHYVMSLSGMPADGIRVVRGNALFAKTCVACHGPEGKGNPAMGAPDLTDKVWLHGSSEAQIVETITKGRTDQMPAHKDILSPSKIHLLTAYVYSLSHNDIAPHRK
jgi:cytochrome c oxidase cbb3-type subunit III